MGQPTFTSAVGRPSTTAPAGHPGEPGHLQALLRPESSRSLSPPWGQALSDALRGRHPSQPLPPSRSPVSALPMLWMRNSQKAEEAFPPTVYPDGRCVHSEGPTPTPTTVVSSRGQSTQCPSSL